MKKIAILGAGVVGQTLAAGFLKHGYEVVMGIRNPDQKVDWKDRSLSGIETATYEGAARIGEIVVLAVKGAGAKNVIEVVAPALAGKTVIDVTNPILDVPPEDGVIKFFTKPDQSLMELLQRIASDANFVKAFNSVGSASMVNPDFGDVRPTMFICGNDEKAKKDVAEILDKFGWEVEDMGKANAARVIEPLCILWCIPGFLRNDWTHAFKMLKK